MADLTAQRTLVKSPPELWSELSEVEGLAKHLGELGEIRITKVEPESTVAWEGDDVCGTVELEQSGWGTKVTFRATVPEPGPAAAPPPVEAIAVAPAPEAVAPEPEAVAPEPETVVPEPVAPSPELEPAPRERRSFLARWLFRQRTPQAVAATPEPQPAEPRPADPEREPLATESQPAVAQPLATEPPAAEPAASAAGADAVVSSRVQEVLDSTLDALGQAHHRPFSRG